MGQPGLLIGEYHHSIDEKGRLTIPAKFREDLGERFILTKGLDSCLFLFPLAEWKTVEERLRSLSVTRADARAFTRLLFAAATEGEMDKQGRVVIPRELRDYAKISSEAAIIGVSTRVEVWAEAEWRQYREQSETSFGALAEKLADIVI